jgi:5-methylcytosine-specific restriction protein A
MVQGANHAPVARRARPSVPSAPSGILPVSNDRRRLSGGKWQRVRAQQLRDFPLCATCLAETPERVTAATRVDHVIPLFKGDEHGFFNGVELEHPSNYASLCAPHHDEKSAAEAGKTYTRRLGCDVNGNPLDDQHHWNKRR